MQETTDGFSLDEVEGELRSAEDGEALIVELVGRHADELLSIARRNTLCADDAFDAYQRTLEIALRHVRRLERETAHRWMFRVCRNEALALRRQRRADVALADVDFDTFADDASRSPEDRVLAAETVDRSAEALKRLKPNELRALWLRASGLSYAEICGVTGWTRTKVNRCICEGRRAFLARYAEIETGAECERWSRVRSAMVDGEAEPRELAAFRPHLRNCPGCRATVRALQQTRPGLRMLLPVGALGTSSGGRGRSDALANWLTRGWEALVGPAGERATASAVKLQAAVEATSAGKLTALAASTVAVAGGGAAVVEQAVRPTPRSASVRVAPDRGPLGGPVAVPVRAGVEPGPAVPVTARLPAPARRPGTAGRTTPTRTEWAPDRPERRASAPVRDVVAADELFVEAHRPSVAAPSTGSPQPPESTVAPSEFGP